MSTHTDRIRQMAQEAGFSVEEEARSTMALRLPPTSPKSSPASPSLSRRIARGWQAPRWSGRTSAPKTHQATPSAPATA